MPRHKTETTYKQKDPRLIGNKFAIGNKNKGSLGKKIHSEEWKEQLRKRMSGNQFAKGRKFKHSLRTKEKIAVALLRTIYNKNSKNKLEALLETIIKSHNLPFKYVGNGQVFIAAKCPDFINCNGKKQIIELAGRFWHTEREMQIRFRLFERYGFKSLVIWDSDFIRTSRSYKVNKVEEIKIVNKIKEFMEAA